MHAASAIEGAGPPGTTEGALPNCGGSAILTSVPRTFRGIAAPGRPSTRDAIRVARDKRMDAPDEPIVDSGPRPHDRQARVQPLDGSAGGAVHSSVHRPGLRVQRLQSADDQADRHHQVRARRLEAHRTRLDFLDRHLLSRAFPRRCSAAGSRRAGRAGPCSPPRCASAAVSCQRLRRLESISSGSSISAMACSAGSAWASATSRRSRR